jgi:hypothetical protein
MWNNKLGLATLTLGSVLTLLGPTVASAQDRGDYRQRDDRGYQRDDRGYSNSFRNRQIELERARQRQRLERERFEQRRNWDRFHTNSYSNRDRSFNNGYYDNFGRWHN